MKSIDSPQKALETLFERHTEDEARSTVAMLTKIIGRIVSNPKEAKYRRISLQNDKIKTFIVTPLGALKFLEFFGSERVVERDELFPDDVLRTKKFLVYSKVNVTECNEALSMLKAFGETEKTIVFEVMERIENIEADDLWMALMHCHLMLNNILISPQSQHLRMIRVDDDIFKRRVGRFPVFQKMLKSLGFKLEDRVKGRVFILQNANFRMFSSSKFLNFLKSLKIATFWRFRHFQWFSLKNAEILSFYLKFKYFLSKTWKF